MLKSLPFKSRNLLNVSCFIYYLVVGWERKHISVITHLKRRPGMCVEVRVRGGGGVLWDNPFQEQNRD